MNQERALKARRGPAVLALGMIGGDHRAEILPGYDLLHIRQKLLATGRLPMGLEGTSGSGELSAWVLSVLTGAIVP